MEDSIEHKISDKRLLLDSETDGEKALTLCCEIAYLKAMKYKEYLSKCTITLADPKTWAENLNEFYFK